MHKKNCHLRKIPAKSRAMRHIPKASKGHFVGELVYNGDGQPQRIGFASHLEYSAALCFIYRPDFRDIEEQLPGLPFNHPNGKLSRHFFDFRFTQRGGRRICVSVKPEKTADTHEYQFIIERVAKAAIGNICDAVVTVTERNIHPVRLHNAKLFHAARDAEPELDAIVVGHLQGVSDPISIGAFLEKSNVGGRGFFSVARAIRFEQVQLFRPDRITGNTLISCKKAA
jgi:hypothetical protein